MSLEALVRAGGEGRKDSVHEAYKSLPEAKQQLLKQVLEDPQFTNPQIAQVLNQELDDHGIDLTVNREQVRHMRSKIREGKVTL